MPKKTLISIVDDDESVREGTMDLVRSMGFVAKAFPHSVGSAYFAFSLHRFRRVIFGD